MSHNLHHGPGHGFGHGAGHDHEPRHNFRSRDRSRLWIVLLLTLGFMSVEVVAGMYTGSLALFADAGHMFSDAAGLFLAIIAIWFASRPATLSKSYGYYRTEILVSLFNALMLMAISGLVLITAWSRFNKPAEVISGPMFWVAVLGLAVNFIALRILHSSSQNSLNMRGAYLEVLSDMIGSAGVLIASLVIRYTGWLWVDTLVSVCIGLLIIPRTWKLLSECVNILMEGTPGRIDLRSLKDELSAVEGVIDVHDLHVWTITSGLDSMSAHVLVDCDVSPVVVLEKIHAILEEKFQIHHSTVQTELVNCKQGCDRRDIIAAEHKHKEVHGPGKCGGNCSCGKVPGAAHHHESGDEHEHNPDHDDGHKH